MAADDGLPGSSSALVEVDVAFSWSGAEHWRVVDMHLVEALSEVPEGALSLACESAEADPELLLGELVTLSWGRGGGTERHFAGIVVSVDDRGLTADRRVAEVGVAPRLWRLGLRENYRVFQGLDAIAVVVRMLSEGGGPYAAAEVDRALVAARTPRAYCVQYGETDLAFVRRLLEEEGVGFAFEHGSDGERMVLFDGEQLERLRPESVALALMGDGGATASEETLRALGSLSRLTTTRVSLGDWDPRAARRVVTDVAGADSTDARFEFPGRHLDGTFVEGSGNARLEANTAQRRTGEHAGRRRAFAGEGNVSLFEPGFRFSREAPGTPAVAMVVTRVVHSASAPEVLYGARGGSARDRYTNRFDCVPVATPWRPARVTPRPRALAPQSAVVTAPANSSEEIYTDEIGRVRVQFHWQRDEASPQWNGSSGLGCTSCWVRVQQPWAAAGWGAVFIPRVGMEVVVQFLDGDPDRPVVSGCVYNGATELPVDLPAQRTQSVLRTRSSPDSDGYNELRFEDLTDHEEVYLRAQRDLREHVRHDHKRRVDRDEHSGVGRDSTTAIKRDRSLSVDGAEDHVVKKNRSRETGGNDLTQVTGNRSVVVHKANSEHANETHRFTADEGATVEVGGGSGSSVQMIPDEMQVVVPKALGVAVGDDGMKVTVDPDNVVWEVPKKFTLKVGDTSIEVTTDKITLKTGAGAKVVLDGDKISVSTGGNVEVKGSQVKVNG